MRIKSPRRPPALILTLGCAAAALLATADVRRRRAEAGVPPEARLAALQRAAAEPGATADDWRAFARALSDAGRFGPGAQAWRRTLEMAPYDAEAADGLAVALAESGDREALMEYLEEYVTLDARTALLTLQRPALVRHASDARYGRLLAEARSQAVD